MLCGALCASIGCLPETTSAAPHVVVVRPQIDRHDRIAEILRATEPAPTVRVFELERAGDRTTLEFDPAYGEARSLSLRGVSWVVLENTPRSALENVRSDGGASLDRALAAWVRQGGRLLVVGGPPSYSTYPGSALADVLPVVPSKEPEPSRPHRPFPLTGEGTDGLHVSFLHLVEKVRGSVRIRSNRDPVVVEGAAGRGFVVAVLTGVQGQRLLDRADRPEDWFESLAWEDFLRHELEAATHTRVGPGLATRLPVRVPPPPDAFDIRYFSIGNHPWPATQAPGEAAQHARELADQGFTSVVLKANPLRPRNDLRVAREIADAGLRIVYYETLRKDSGKDRFAPHNIPMRAPSTDGRKAGWDIHGEAFRSSADSLLEDREFVRELPLRALQVLEEFQDGGQSSPALRRELRARGVKRRPSAGDPGWITHEVVHADASADTFARFRAAAKRFDPSLPQSTYWPGSYWHRPHDYTFRLTALADAVDEILAPGYGYQSDMRNGRLSVVRSATEAFGAMGHRVAPGRHLAVYALGRPLRRGGPGPDAASWRETTWTALAHGATGLAYWAMPRGEAVASLTPLHDELRLVGPWLRVAERPVAPVAVLGSWTSRSEGVPEQAATLSACFQRIQGAIELGFESGDVVYEERLDALPTEVRVIVLTASPALDPAAIGGLRPVRRGRRRDLGRARLRGEDAAGRQPPRPRQRRRRPDEGQDVASGPSLQCGPGRTGAGGPELARCAPERGAEARRIDPGYRHGRFAARRPRRTRAPVPAQPRGCAPHRVGGARLRHDRPALGRPARAQAAAADIPGCTGEVAPRDTAP